MSRLFAALAVLLFAASASAQTVNGVPSQNVSGTPSQAINYGGVNLFGDSITQGTGSSTFMSGGANATAYAYKVLAAFGGGGQNWGYGGDQAEDMSFKVYAVTPHVDHNFADTILISTNDVSVYGTNTNQQDTFTKALEASIAWLAIPDVAKAPAQNSECTASGSWTAVNGPITPTNVALGRYSSTHGDTLTCTITTYGSALYIAYQKHDGWTGTASVTIDGSAAPGADANLVSYGLANSTINTSHNLAQTFALARYTGIAAGTHTVVITNTGTTGAQNFVYINWLGSPYQAASTTVAPPVVYVGGTPWDENDQREPASGQYNTLIRNAVSALAGDGLNVHFVDVRAYENSTTDYDGGTLTNGYVCPASTLNPLHPGDCGHAHLAQAFLAAMNPPARGMAGISPFPSAAVGTYGVQTANTAHSFSLNGDNRDGYRLGLADGASTDTSGGTGAPDGNLYIDVPSGGAIKIRPNGSLTPSVVIDSTGCSSGCGTPTGLTSSGGVLTNQQSGTAAGMVMTSTAASSSVVTYGFNAPGVDSVELGCWGTGNGAGLAGICGEWDSTLSTFLWVTNPSGDIGFNVPVSGGNVAAMTGAKFVLKHDGTTTGFPTGGGISYGTPTASGTGVSLASGSWPLNDSMFVINVIPTGAVAANTSFATVTFGKTWKNAAGNANENPVCVVGAFNSAGASAPAYLISVTQSSIALASPVALSAQTYQYTVRCGGDNEL